MADDDFFEEDEPTEKIRAAWKRSKKGRTGLPRDMNQPAPAVVAQTVAKTESLVLTVPTGSPGSIVITKSRFQWADQTPAAR